jgi:hypothetical protein
MTGNYVPKCGFDHKYWEASILNHATFIFRSII